MTNAIQHLQEFIKGLEAEQQRLEEAIAGAAELLRKLTPDAEGSKSKKSRPPASATNGNSSVEPFQRKYDENSRVLVLRVLEELPSRQPLAIPEIVDRLRARGREFHRETVNYALKNLVKRHQVEKIPADEGSAYKWRYRALRVGEDAPHELFKRPRGKQ